LAVEKQRLQSYFLELKKKKKEQHELAKRGQETFTRHLGWYEGGKERSLALSFETAGRDDKDGSDTCDTEQ
jgi:hypothetical protein